MKKIIIAIALLFSASLYSQVGIGTTNPSAKSILDLSATDKGFLLPRMTTAQRVAIAPNNTTDRGMQVYDTNTLSIWYWNGSIWIQQGSKNIYDTNGDISPSASTNRSVNFSNGGILNFDQNTLAVEATLHRVGIVTATPSTKLEVNTNSDQIETIDLLSLSSQLNIIGQKIGLVYKANGGIPVGRIDSDYTASGEFGLGFSTFFGSLSRKMTLASNGNLGIGTATPNALLQLDNSVTNRKIVLYEAANNDHQYFGFGINGGVLRYQISNPGDSHIFYSGTNSSNSNELMRISGSGNVGIGTTGNPTTKLQVISPSTDRLDGGSTIGIFNPAAPTVNNFAGIQLKSSTGVGSWKIGVNQETTTDRDQNFYFLNAGGGQFVPRMVITQVGNVGIGITSPGSKLHVHQGNISVTNANGVNVFSTTASRVAYFSGASANNDGLLALHMSNNTTGNGYISFEDSAGATIGRITRAGATSVAYNTTSDERLKENIRSTKMGIQDLMKIQVADYVYKADKDIPQTGFIAQQLHTVFPNAVTVGGVDEKNNPWGVDYGKVSPLIVKAVQDLKNEIDSQKVIIENQQKQI